MESRLKKMLCLEISKMLASIQDDSCVMTDAEAMKIISTLSHEAMSKEQVLTYLNWSRAKFDDYVGRGLMPKGHKRTGFKELCWYRDEINDAIINIKNKNYS